MKQRKSLIALLVFLSLFVGSGVALAQGFAGWYDVENNIRVHGNVWANMDVTVDDDLTVGDTLAVADVSASDDMTVTDDLIVTGKINLQPNEQNIGVMSVMTAAVTYLSSGAIFTVTSGELWVVHEVLLNVLTNFNCTGDDCTLIVGDSNDTDGFLVLADAALQAADTEFTGAEAGWQGMAAATQGVYLDEVTTSEQHWYVYSGSETVDIAVGGTSPAAGTAIVYLFYTRIH